MTHDGIATASATLRPGSDRASLSRHLLVASACIALATGLCQAQGAAAQAVPAPFGSTDKPDPASGPAGPASASGPATPGEQQVSGSGDVIVTARRRAENIQDVPAAITAITSADLAARQIVTQNDLKFSVPSLSLQGRYGHQGGTYAIRGLAGPTSGNPTVGTYFAEVPSPTAANGYDAAAGSSLYDLDSVQVLKGPQGTLFGRTSTAGAVLVTPRRPDLTRYQGDLEVTAGSLGRTELTAAVNVPVIKDVLAIRAALNRNHVDGYTKIIGTDNRLDETNTRSFRISVEFEPTSWLKNTTIYDDNRVDEAPGSYILSAYNANLPAFLLPANTTAFNTVCAGAVALGLSANVPTCVAQRIGILATMKAQLAAELARTSQGGSALRYSNVGNSAYDREESHHQEVVNTTTIKLPTLGVFETQVKNIFGYQLTKGLTGQAFSDTPSPTYIQYFGIGAGASSNQSGNQAVTGLGQGNRFYTDEVQLSGTVDRTRLVYVLGYYYQRAPVTQQLDGVSLLSQTLGGITTPNLGFAAATPFAIGGAATQKAYYGQATLSLDGLINGVHLTAGYRHSNDDVSQTTAAAVTNYVTGAITPSATQTTSAISTAGDGYNFSIDYKPTRGLLLYATTRKGYVPGGLNTFTTNSSTLQNYSPVYGSENIKDYEIGAKWDFRFGSIPGRFNVDYYHDDYSNIQRTFTGITSVGSVLTYTANVAAARLQGVEVELNLQPVRNSSLSVNYSYNETGYTKWVGADPLNVAPAGTVLDLSRNPFPNAPQHKLSVNWSHGMPLSGNRGLVTASAQAYYQSLEWFSTSAQRYMDIYGAGLAGAISQKAYALVNARLDWSDAMGVQGLSVGVFGRNLTDKLYTTSGVVSLATFGVATKTYGEPRSYGVNLSYHF